MNEARKREKETTRRRRSRLEHPTPNPFNSSPSPCTRTPLPPTETSARAKRLTTPAFTTLSFSISLQLSSLSQLSPQLLTPLPPASRSPPLLSNGRSPQSPRRTPSFPMAPRPRRAPSTRPEGFGGASDRRRVFVRPGGRRREREGEKEEEEHQFLKRRMEGGETERRRVEDEKSENSRGINDSYTLPNSFTNTPNT